MLHFVGLKQHRRAGPCVVSYISICISCSPLPRGMQGVCFGVIKRKRSSTRGPVGRGHGFVMLKHLEEGRRAGKVVHDSGSSVSQLPRCWWTAPAWFTFDIGKLTVDFGKLQPLIPARQSRSPAALVWRYLSLAMCIKQRLSRSYLHNLAVL